MILKEIMQVIDYNEIINRCGLDINTVAVDDICFDSRKATPTSVFVCLTGALVDGHDYALGAYERGCRVFVAERYVKRLPDDAFVIIAPDTRVALAELSANFFGYPSRELTIIGVTGTKGKTTSSLLIYNVLNENGIKTGYIGSNGVSYEDVWLETVNTTPESHDIHSIMRKMRDSGVTTLVMEVSSQALKMARVHGIKFDICVFTNLAPDHIGEFEHSDFEEYKNCKRSLFTDYGADYVVYNADDEYAMSVVGGGRSEKAGISVKGEADFKAGAITYFRSAGNIGVSFECTCDGGKTFPVALSFPGEFSVYNAMVAIAVCSRLGLSAGKITKTLRHVRIKGRFETHELPCGATVVIDYAHNGVSLKAALAALRIYDPQRLVCLFGAIGGRTKMRRTELGLVASRDADFCILTSDNPDNESPNAIISEIASYFTAGTCPYVAITDRKKAIEYALKNAQAGDIILLAGKGHESYQLICGVREHFSETEIVEEYCIMNSSGNQKGRYPLKLSYTAKTALWAGKRLKEEFKKQSEHQTISETWELSVREDEMAKILNGEAEGMTLAEYFDKYGYDCVTPSFKKGDRFPLLVKLIDAADILSVQVHPDDEYAAIVEGDSGKTEMWYIIDAKRDAQLVYGLKDGITREEFAKAIDQKRINAVMNQRPVKAGETYFIPAGMIHAIGAGILIAEIQQNADLTYRVYDFDRLGPDGKLRQLHVEKALDVTRSYTEEEINAIRYACGSSCESGELLANSVYFSARKLCVKASDEGQKITATKDSFVSVLCIGGEGEISFGGEKYPVSIGDSYLLPAGMGACMLSGDVTVILSEV